jgi:type II secretory pathway predicted ATPase ExeA
MTDTPKDLRAHFGFTTMPFTREVAIQDRWSTPLFDEPLAALLHTVEQRMSAALLAPSGAGKTMLLRSLRALLPEARYRVRYVKLTPLSKRDLCREIATACALDLTGSYPVLMHKLQDAFRSQSDDDGLRPVLLIDESQDLRPDVLTTFRVLTNFDMDSRLVLSLVLAGDTQLRALLDRPELEPIRRRMAHFASLRLLSRTETADYMHHRLRIAGATQSPFDSQALDAVYEITRGNLRAIDHLARKSLEWAAQRNIPAVDPTAVAAARQNLLL